MKKFVLLITLFAMHGIIVADEKCTFSMMGQVCYEEGKPSDVSPHMKGDAVAAAEAKKKEELKNHKTAKK